MQARSPNESPDERVRCRSRAISIAMLLSNGKRRRSFPMTPLFINLRATLSGSSPKSDSLLNVSAQFTTLIAATLRRAVRTVSAPGSSCSQARRAEASKTLAGTPSTSICFLSELLAAAPESTPQRGCAPVQWIGTCLRRPPAAAGAWSFASRRPHPPLKPASRRFSVQAAFADQREVRVCRDRRGAANTRVVGQIRLCGP